MVDIPAPAAHGPRARAWPCQILLPELQTRRAKMTVRQGLVPSNLPGPTVNKPVQLQVPSPMANFIQTASSTISLPYYSVEDAATCTACITLPTTTARDLCNCVLLRLYGLLGSRTRLFCRAYPPLRHPDIKNLKPALDMQDPRRYKT